MGKLDVMYIQNYQADLRDPVPLGKQSVCVRVCVTDSQTEIRR